MPASVTDPCPDLHSTRIDAGSAPGHPCAGRCHPSLCQTDSAQEDRGAGKTAREVSASQVPKEPHSAETPASTADTEKKQARCKTPCEEFCWDSERIKQSRRNGEEIDF